jgi:hypothetical protein
VTLSHGSTLLANDASGKVFSVAFASAMLFSSNPTASALVL